jgi:hypothetical protein
MKKKHFYARLLPLLIPACALDTPVAESEARFDDPLGEDLEPWCESACEKSTNCGRNEDDCAEKCIDSFTRWFIGKGEICEAIALGVMDCFDTVTCSQLAAGACDSEAIDRCEASQQVSCTSHGMGDGESDGNSLTCSAFYDRCTDGRYYAVECAGSDPLECSCTIDGTTGGRFRFNRGSCPESFEAREICAWPIVPWSGEPTTPPVICNAVTVNGPAGACQIDVGDCADAATYGVICDGATKMCTCLVDGEAVRDFIASESVCPYVLDPDGGAAALNAACGFSIAWSTVIE